MRDRARPRALGSFLADDYVHFSPHPRRGPTAAVDAQLKPIIDNPARGVVVGTMQTDFCSQGGWADASGLDHKACREATPGVQRAIEAARRGPIGQGA